MSMNIIHWIAVLLVVIGGINWGVIGVTGRVGDGLNLVTFLLGTGILTNIVYILVGIAALYILLREIKK